MAKKAFKQGGLVDPLHSYKKKVKALHEKGDLKSAIDVLDAALKKHPEAYDLRFMLGKLHVDDKNLKEAAEVFQEVVDYKPDHVSTLVELGQVHLKMGNASKALKLLTVAYEQAPHLAATNVSYASALHRFGHLHEAINHYREALRLQAGKPSKDKRPPLRDDFNKPETEKLMWDTLAELCDAGIHAFACYGSLLGPIREGGLLPFDKDLDFALPYCEMKRADRVMKKNGWVRANHASAFFNPVAYYHSDPEATVDLFGMMVEESTGTTGFWMPGVPKEWNQFTEYSSLELVKDKSPEGGDIWTLKDPEAMLETIYGPEWKVPDGYFDTVIAAKNIRGFSLVTQCFAYPRIYSNIEAGNVKKAAALVSVSLKGMPGDELLCEIRNNLVKHEGAREFLC